MICVFFLYKYRTSFYFKKYLNFSFFFLYKFFFKYGSSILLLYKGLILTYKKYLKLRLFLKRFIRKPDKTLKKLWLSPYHIFQITLKSKGSRMGKGKGGTLIPVLRFYPGKPFIEVSNMRLGSLLFFTKYLGLYLHNLIFLLTNNQNIMRTFNLATFFIK